MKIPVHIRYWQLIESGHLNSADQYSFTNSATTGEPWFVDDRAFPGFDRNDAGQQFSLDRFNRAMMVVSDNGATSMLIDHTGVGLSWDALDLNEWLADVAGTGRGFGPIVSIHNRDRFQLWQG